MEVGVRELRNHTKAVLAAVQSGERVVLTLHGTPVADIVPHRQRSRWVSGESLAAALATQSADPGLRNELDSLAGDTLADLDPA